MSPQSMPGSQGFPAHLAPPMPEIEEHFRANLPAIVGSYFEMKQAALKDGRTSEEAEVIALTWIINRSLGVYSSMLEPRLAQAFETVSRR